MTTHNINGQEPPTSTAIPRRSWRDVLSVHPAAELFPQMSADELRELGEDIKKARRPAGCSAGSMGGREECATVLAGRPQSARRNGSGRPASPQYARRVA